MHLLCDEGTEGVEALVAEELGKANLAHKLPVRARLREEDVGAAVQLRRHGGLHAKSEGLIMGLKDESGHGGCGGDDNGHRAEAKEDERAIGFTEVGKRDVWISAKQVEVADKGKAARPWRQLEL